ncbi:MAG: EAL domain-containing protein, partial [Gammaproteobacteria bacterium]|nr:EAL domain-containing protein [Gammaproteobacteria bacterium]
MQFIVSQSLRHDSSLKQLIRELSLSVGFFSDAQSLNRLMRGESRRIVMLTESDVSEAAIAVLEKATATTTFGLILCTDRERLRSSNRAALLAQIIEFNNVEWIRSDWDLDALSRATRGCRRRMLRVARAEIEQAIAKREFLIQYQPKVDRGNGQEWLTREVEALIRWRHPVHGLLGPLEFLPDVEAFGLTAAVAEYVLNETAAQLVQWRESKLSLNGCINLASSLLNRNELADRYAEIVREHGLECSSFTFEVTEKEVANSDAPHLKVLGALRARGFRISLDDFGVAASSLGTFEQLPFDEIKIHATVLRRARNNDVTQKILAAITGLAHKLGISVCAEGVEDQETFDFLKTINCDKMQGFFISEAVLPDIIRRVYRAGSGKAQDV